MMSGLRRLCCVFLLLPALVAGAGSTLHAQTAGGGRLFEQEPFDVVVVIEEAKEKEFKLRPLKLNPRRRPTNTNAADKIRVRLYDDVENREFELFWKDVEAVRFFEELVLAEAEKLANDQKFDDAWEVYLFLLREYPKTNGLDQSLQSYLYLHAGASFRQRKNEEALSILEELLKANPKYQHSEKSPSLMKVLNGIAERIIQQYYEQKNYAAARSILARLTTSYPESREQPFATKWQQTLSSDAARKRDEARRLIAANKLTEAYDTTLVMLDIWPDVEGGRSLAREISEAYPIVSVGVSAKGIYPGVFRFDSWANRRTGRLVDRRLVEPVGIGPEGGEYATLLGSIERSEDGKVLRFQVRPQPTANITAFDFAALLLAGTQESSREFSPAWAEVFRDVRIVSPQLVEVSLRRAHVIPRALPTFALRSLDIPPEDFVRRVAAYQMIDSPAQTRFVIPPEAPARAGVIREVKETMYTDMPAALLDLERGRIQCLDRLQPADVARVQSIPGVNVVRYPLPVLHVLVPNIARPWPKLRTFRRAIIYGIQRETLLRYGVLRESPGLANAPPKPISLPGAQLISGPFPAALRPDDPNAYAYDPDIQPHTYEPLLSVMLLEIAKREAKSLADEKKQPAPVFQKLVIGHPAAELPRIVCRGMVQQLAPLGVACQLVELDGREAMPAEVDFVYAEITMAEPTVDVARLFGPRGLFPTDNPHVRLAVRRVEQAGTWKEASQRLRDLHRVLHEELTVLPLFQTPEFCAFGSAVSQFSPAPLTFYHNVESWRVAPRGGT